MLKHKNINKISWAAVVLVIVIAILFSIAGSFGWIEADNSMGYESRLFNASSVHTIDIVMDDWDGFIDNITMEEYSSCTIVIDGEKYSNVGIRGKGNTSLSQVEAYGNDRYSFKVEFDQYNSGNSYYGLDKISLNNIISDNTYMKDYLSYQMMNYVGVASPLCSYVSITVNDENWGLYLAVESVEESFLQRNYGTDYGNLYKPDNLDMGGGRGNGADFNPDNFMDESTDKGNSAPSDGGTTAPDGIEPSTMFGEGGKGDMVSGMNGGSSDVNLQYIDDDSDSYSNIFNSAKTDITESDKTSLIASLKQLSEGENINEVVDVEAVIKYLVAHSFVCNNDSYTGMMVHNYYLYEENGVLSMLPWDYNLAFGSMGMSDSGNEGCTSDVNSPIDSPVTSGTLESRPMVAWIFESEEYTELYHQYYVEFIETYFDSSYFKQMIDETIALISPYVEKDATAFCTYDEFLLGSNTLREWCLLRAESISGQLDGTIPSTQSGQSADSSALIDASQISTADMGEFNNGDGGGFGGGNIPDRGERSTDGTSSSNEQGNTSSNNTDSSDSGNSNVTQKRPDDETFSGDFDRSKMPGGTSLSSGGALIEIWLLLGGCVLVLFVGLLIAKKYKR